MSDTSQGEGWWIASDGKWYAPELHPDYAAPPTPVTPPPVAPPPVTPPPTAPAVPTAAPAVPTAAAAPTDRLETPTYPSHPPTAPATVQAAAATVLPDELTPPAAPATSRRGLLLGVGALVLLVGLGFLLFRVLGGGGTSTGAASPDAAVQQLIDSVRELDPVGLAEVLDPDEVEGWAGSFAPATETLQSLSDDAEPTDQFDAFAQELAEAISVAITGPGGDDITYDVRELDPRGRISRVRIEGLDVTISVNEGFDEALIAGPPAELIAVDLAAIDGANLTLRDQLGGLDVRAFAPEQGTESGFADNVHLDLVTVEKDGSWYVSIGYSILENIQNDPNLNLGRPDYGRAYALVDAGDGGAETPEDVVRQMMTAMETLDYAAMIALTDPLSMPYLHDFQPAIDDNVDQRDITDASQELGVRVDTLELGTTAWNERTLVTVEQIAGRFAEGAFELDTTTWCAQATSSEGDEISGCLDEAVDELLREIDETNVNPNDVVPEHLGFVVIERNGRWFFDPLGSLGYYLDEIADTLADLDVSDAFAQTAAPVGELDGFLALNAPIVQVGETVTSAASNGNAGVAFDLTGLDRDDVTDFDTVQIGLAKIESDGTGSFVGYDDRDAAATEWAVVYATADDDPSMPAVVLATEGSISVTLEEATITRVESGSDYSGAIDADGRPQILVFEGTDPWTFSGEASYEDIYTWDAPAIAISGGFYSQQFGDPSYGDFAVVTGAPGATFAITADSFASPDDASSTDDNPPAFENEPPPPTGDPRVDRFIDVAVAGEFVDFSFEQNGGYFDGCGPDDPDVTTWAYSDTFGDLALVTPFPSEERAMAAFEALTRMTAPCESFPELEFQAIDVGPGDTVTLSFSFDGGETVSWERYGRRGDVIIATTSTSLDWLDINWSRLELYEG